MKQLFWKEWYELRLLPLASAVCVALLIFTAKVFAKTYDSAHRFTFGDTILPLVATWMLFGLLAGAGLIAQEVGSGGLQFLSALPVSRPRVWWVKVITALGMLLLSVLTSAAAWAVIDAFVFQSAFFNDPFWHGHMALWAMTGMALLLLLGFFAVALAVSPFLDRPISAVVAALLTSIAWLGILQNAASEYVDYVAHGRMYTWQPNDPHTHDIGLILMLMVALSIPVFAAISYWTFTRGETLRSARRFRVGALTGTVSLVMAGLIFVAGWQMQLW
ncbi:MAG: ABC transporter permease subunit [Armatimonadetes bacterium]|nr:ABC transporter permease subunit [Armatimonadota bacterium]